MLEFKKKKKNYFILITIYVVVIIVVLYFASWYNTYQAYQNEIPVLKDTISQLQPEELEHYLFENPSSIIYFCSASSKTCRNFEEQLKQEIINYGWQAELTYVNLNSISSKDSYLQDLIMQYGENFTVGKEPLFIAFQDGAIKSIISSNDNQELTISSAVEFIKDNQNLDSEG